MTHQRDRSDFVSEKYDIAVYIGRFQPFHNGHLHTCLEALKLAKRLVIIVGSAQRPRCIENPFNFVERRDVISGALTAAGYKEDHDFHIAQQVDYKYNDPKWEAEIQASVNKYAAFNSVAANPKVCIIGYNKDETSWYLKKFPQWSPEMLAPFNGNRKRLLNATDIRHEYFAWEDQAYKDDVPEATNNFLFEFKKNSFYYKLQKALKMNIAYKSDFKDYKYKPGPIFQTVDAVVLCASHVLLVQRKAEPGEGLWAMPGGFLNYSERIKAGIIRELIEETCIAVDEHVLMQSMAVVDFFDHPRRSTRGRIITHAGLIILDSTGVLPKVKGSDDAKDAKWIPVSKFYTMREQMFEDHYDIIYSMISRARTC